MLSLVKRPGSCLARLVVSIATLVWSCAALTNAHSDLFWWVILILALFSICRIVTVSSLRGYEQIGYAVQTFLWVSAAGNLFVYPDHVARPPEIAGIVVVAALSIYSLIARPRNIHGSK